MSVSEPTPPMDEFGGGNSTVQVAPEQKYELYIIYFSCAAILLGAVFFVALRKSIKLCFFSTFYGHREMRKAGGPGMKTVYNIDLEKLQNSFTRFKSKKQGLATDEWIRTYGSSGTLSTAVSLSGLSHYGSSRSLSTLPSSDIPAVRRSRTEKVEFLRALWKDRRTGSKPSMRLTSMFKKNNGSDTSSLSRFEKYRQTEGSDVTQEAADASVLAEGDTEGGDGRSGLDLVGMPSGRSSPTPGCSYEDENSIGGLHETSFSEDSVCSMPVAGPFPPDNDKGMGESLSSLVVGRSGDEGGDEGIGNGQHSSNSVMSDEDEVGDAESNNTE